MTQRILVQLITGQLIRVAVYVDVVDVVTQRLHLITGTVAVYVDVVDVVTQRLQLITGTVADICLLMHAVTWNYWLAAVYVE